jgi:predicted flavoprotein YhiN
MTETNIKPDVIIIGAGAAGLMCAMTAGKRGRKVLLLDHSKNVGEKIRISGGGRCNFTNMNTGRQHFISDNPRFCRSVVLRWFGKPDHRHAAGRMCCRWCDD